MANRITKQKWDEISGVDAPANGSPGWLLQKAADEVEDFEAAIVALHKALGSDSAQLFFKDADDSVQKSVSKLLKHLDENIEEVEDGEAEEDGEQEEVKKEKRGIAKLAEILKVSVTKSEDGDEAEDEAPDEDDKPDEGDEDEDAETSDEDETDESDDEPGDEDDTDENKDDEDDEKDEPVAKATALQKSDVDAIVSAFKEELDPIREAVGALADRTEGLEKHAAGRTSILGQDGSEDEDDDDENAVLHKAFTAAARGAGKIELN